jgi:hypothetical protein
MPGNILMKECKARLEVIRKEHPEVFSSRSLYSDVMRIFDSYTFKLNVRRDLVNMFSEAAKMKHAPNISTSHNNTIQESEEESNSPLSLALSGELADSSKQ